MYTFIILLCTLGNPCVTLTDREGTRYPTYSACVQAATLRRDQLMRAIADQGYTPGHSDVQCWPAPPSA